MKRLFEIVGITVLTLIPVTALLVMFEIVTFPNRQPEMGYLIAGYLILVLVLLGREILMDLWRWLQGGER